MQCIEKWISRSHITDSDFITSITWNRWCIFCKTKKLIHINFFENRYRNSYTMIKRIKFDILSEKIVESHLINSFCFMTEKLFPAIVYKYTFESFRSPHAPSMNRKTKRKI